MQQTNTRRRMRFLAVSLSLVLAMSFLGACGNKKAATDDKAVATYKGGTITQSEFDTFVGVNVIMDSTGQVSGMLAEPQYKEYIQEQLLKQQVVWEILDAKTSDANRKEGEKQAEELDKQIKGMEAAQKESFEKAMKDNKVTVKDLKRYVTVSTGISKEMESKVTEQEIKAVYDEHLKTNPNFYDVVNVRHILIGVHAEADEAKGTVKRTKEEALKIANDVKAKLDAGGDFAALAKEFSEDGNKDTGGLYADQQIGTSSFVEPFLKKMTELEINKISEPVETDFGYHVMRVDSRKTLKLDDVKASIKSEKSQTNLSSFVEKDFLTYDYVSLLPKASPSPSAAASPAASADVAASPAASVSPEAKK
ncbi:MAG: peptidylprolyl isomerase [Gorillibacterium sp.]|nr:peptidylprolyl isomerase [Gorillibacterium sp.]